MDMELLLSQEVSLFFYYFIINIFNKYLLGYRSSGSVDPNVCTNLNNAKSAGITYREVYMFPCPVSFYHHYLSFFYFLI